jgi:diguanylate cyclase (GGDEF)-like protein
MNGKINAFMNYIKERNLFNNASNLNENSLFSNIVEEENYVEFIDNNKTCAALIDGEDWQEVKQELILQKERKEQETYYIQEQKKLDNLTKLFNKEHSRRIIEEYLQDVPEDSRHALMIVDINSFRVVNENLGYLFGDTVLVNIADSLREIFYNTDIAGRIGGDKFIIFLKNVSSRELLQAKADEVFSVFHNTYTGENKKYALSCSIGIAEYPTDGRDFIKLFDNADSALLYSKESLQSYYAFYQDIPINYYINKGDCYNKYGITKTKAYGTSNFDKEITTFAFDIMSRTKDVNSAINLLLNKIRSQFNCSHICIIENSNNDSEYRITYLISKDGIESQIGLEQNNVKHISPDFAKCSILNLTMNPDKFKEKGIFYISDTMISPSEEAMQLNKCGIRSLLQCGIFEDTSFKGCVSIDNCDTPRYWTQYEVDSIVTITKIISSYLLKMRASEKANQKLYQIRNFDALTGLPTLHKFKKDAKKLLGIQLNQKYAIIYSDISRFKYVNDSLGYHIGDKILCDFASLLSETITEHELVARISQDNFLALIGYHNVNELTDWVNSINEQFNLQQKEKYPGIKINIVSGVAIVNNFEEITVTIDNANIARKSIKDSLKTICKFFDCEMQDQLKKEAEIINSMEQALKNKEFIVYLQPKIDLNCNKLVGAEALVRWKKEDIMLPPNDFIPLFEKNGFIVNMDFYIYEEVCKIIQSWLKKGFPAVTISVNVSRVHLNDENFVFAFNKLVDTYEIPHNLLELEITENILLENIDVVATIIKNLRELGYGISIDDFGAGYSSLNVLKEFTTDVLKLDKEFFGHSEMNKEEQIIVSSIISMAKQLNMKVLSEGVETQMQSDFLKSVSCDMAQGYLYSKPVPVSEFEKSMTQCYN